MWRPVLYQAVLFLLPFFLYAIWMFIRRGIDPTRASAWREAPIAWLAISAIVLTLVGLFTVGHFDRAPPGSSYSPARLENGKIVPPEMK